MESSNYIMDDTGIISQNSPITMSTILCFGEILGVCLPHGLFLGGAPFNI